MSEQTKETMTQEDVRLEKKRAYERRMWAYAEKLGIAPKEEESGVEE